MLKQEEAVKQALTSFEGQKEVISSSSSSPSSESSQSPICGLVGHANEAEIVVGSKQCLALVDTGSMVTSIGEDFYRRYLEAENPLEPINNLVNVEGAGGHQLSYSGYSELPLSTKDGDPVWVPVLVASKTNYNSRVPLLLGTNVIKHLLPSASGEAWDIAKKALAVQVTQQTSYPEGVAVYCCRQIVIKPGGRMDFKARVGAKTNIQDGLLEPTTALPGGVFMARAAVSPDDHNQVQVVLQNTSKKTIEIPRRQKIATLHHIKVIQDQVDSYSSQVNTSSSQEKPSPSQDTTPGQPNPGHIPVDVDEANLTEEEKKMVQDTLQKWRKVFAFSKTELGCAKDVEHHILLKDDVPFKERPRRIPPSMYQEVKQHIQEMLACGAIRPSSSPYASGAVLVRKSDGSLRFCLDFRRINSKTIKDAYFLPRIEETIDNLQGATWFSSLDLQAGYWQVPMAEQDKEKTAFVVGGNLGFWECNRMPFGLSNAPATFQRVIEKTLKDLPNCFAYLDDIIIFSSGTVEDHLAKLEKVVERLSEWGWKLKPKKCHLLKKRIKYLGHIVSENGVEADPEKIEAVREWPEPSTVQELRQALGFFGYTADSSRIIAR